MDIFNRNAREVRCVRNDDSLVLGVRGNGHLLVIGETYKLMRVEVGRWDTRVTLEEFPDLQFSSVLFEEMTGEISIKSIFKGENEK